MQYRFEWFVLGLIVFVVIGVVLAKKWGNLKQIIDAMTPVKLAEWLLWVGGGSFISMLLVLAFYWGHFGDLSSQQKDWGEFGGYFGGTLSPILSFLSLMALLFTIVLQSKELELTRDELKRSADAQADTKDILDKQSKTLAKQQFESTFFSLLDQQNKALEPLTAADPGDNKKQNLQNSITLIT